MKDIIKVLDVWVDAEKTLNLSASLGSYGNGYHDGFIQALDKVRLLLEVQPHNKPLHVDSEDETKCTCHPHDLAYYGCRCK